MAYRHILLAIELDDDAQHVVARTIELARRCDAKISAIHVIDPADISEPNLTMAGIPGGAQVPPGAIPGSAEIERERLDHAKDALNQLTRELGGGEVDRQVAISHSTAEAIHEAAATLEADLIVVGSHGRHGLALLFSGSTSKTVLGDAPCDVLAIRIPR